ncbi:MAG: single-stranded-DNA-specific exonuclease RecJ [Bacillota bacterium]
MNILNKWFIENNYIDNDFDNISPVVRNILSGRNIKTRDDITSFLYDDINDLYDPFIFADMSKAVKRIIEAVQNNQKIIVYGDYDVDGITSTSLLYLYFKNTFAYELDYYLPDRRKEGYGLNKDAIEKFNREDYDLIITVDCGITAVEEVKCAKDNAIDIIITDHHQPGNILPSAEAIINPHTESDYPFKFLAGVGVAFKLCQAIEYKKYGKYISENLTGLLDIVTLGTVADVVKLKGENRIIVKEGLKRINKLPNEGLGILINQVGLKNKSINTGHIAYTLAPHLNAAGRVSDASECVKLLTTEDMGEAEQIAKKLCSINKDRQELEQIIFDEASEMVENMVNLDEDNAIILASKKWHHGIIGIVASRLVERYYKPTILIAIEGNIGKGSCRSIKGLNIYEALTSNSKYLSNYGGHEMAAGLTINLDKFSIFKESMIKYINDNLIREDFIPRLKIDSVLNSGQINMELYKELTLLEPHGIGNRRPRFLLNNVTFEKIYAVGKNKDHLKFTLNNGQDGIGFGFGEYKDVLANNKVDIAFTLNLNQWNNKVNLQLCLEDFNIRNNNLYYPVYYKTPKYSFADKRGCFNKCEYIDDLLKRDKKIAVFINHKKYYEKYLNSISNKDSVYYADDLDSIDIFNNAEKGVVFFTGSSKYISLSIDDLIFMSAPFSLQNMNQILKDISFNMIHLLFTEKDMEVNNHIINKMIPDDNYLRELYICLMKYFNEVNNLNDLKEVLSNYSNIHCNKGIIKRSLNIFKELGIINYNKDNSITLLELKSPKLDLSKSISYNYNVNAIKKYNHLSNIIYEDDLSILIKYIEGEIE